VLLWITAGRREPRWGWISALTTTNEVPPHRHSGAPDLSPGDVVELEIDRIGVLRNRIVREP
jgi:2-keto-4-pentenoate hydratase/2-oxohepta-3-ene-1,7-dioic acid hydratase in catechol pathway